jgi:hypothetical protein
VSDSNPCVPVAPSTNVKNTVSLAELLAVIVMSGAVADTVANEKLPLPSVFKNCPVEPSAVGNVNAMLELIEPAALKAT